MPVIRGERQERGRFGTPPAPPRSRTPVPTRSSSPGDPKVARLQTTLNNAGFSVDVDGEWGPQTASAVKAYNAQVVQQNAVQRQKTANVIKTQVTEPRAPRSLISPPPTVRRSVGGGALERYDPYQPNALGNIPGLQPHRKFAQTPDYRTPLDKVLGNIVGEMIMDPFGVLELGKSAVHLAKHPSLRSAGGTALAGVGVVPLFRGPRAASRFARALAEEKTIVEAAKLSATSFGERGPIRAAADARRIKLLQAEVEPVLATDPLRAAVHAEIDQAVTRGELTGEHAQRLKGQLDEKAALYADDLARKSKGGTLKQKRAANSLAYYQHLHNLAYPVERPMPGFDRAPALAEGQKNLRQFTNPRNLGKGGVENPTTHSQLGHAVVGEITPAEHYRRTAESVGHDPELALKLGGWYRELGPLFRTFFGEHTDPILRGFAVSQANASPAGGLQAVLRVRDKLLRGEEISSDEISTVVKSIEAAYKGDPVKSGLAAKLHDFVDSLEGKKTRTWTADDIRGGSPTAIDIHALRDLGRIDPKILKTLRERHGLAVAHLQLEVLNRDLKTIRERKFKPPEDATAAEIRAKRAAFEKSKREGLRNQNKKIRSFKEKNAEAIAEGRRGKLKLDNPQSAASGNAYNAALREYQAITDYYNEIGAFGKHDWTPAEVQALGWSAIQRYHGVVPEDAAFAIDRNTHLISAETLAGRNGFRQTPDKWSEALALTKADEARILGIVDEENGFIRDISYGPSGEGNTITPSLQLQVIGSPEQAERIAQRIADEFQLHEVLATRPGVVSSRKFGRSRFAIEVESPAFTNKASVERFWNKVQELAPEEQRAHLASFAPYQWRDETGRRVYGLRVTTGHGYLPLGKPEAIALKDRYRATLEEAADAVGVGIHTEPNNVEVKAFHGREAHDRERPSGEPSGEPAADHLAAEAAAGGAGPGLPEVRRNVPGLDVPHPEDAAHFDEFGNPIPSVRYASSAPEPGPRNLQEELDAIRNDPASWETTRAGRQRMTQDAARRMEELRAGFGDQSLATPSENVSPLERPHPDDFAEETLATPHEPLSDLSPEEQLRQGLRSAPSHYGKKRKLQSEDRRERARKMQEALRTISDPDEAMAAATEAMRGELATIDFHGLTTLNPDSLKYLKRHVLQLDTLAQLPYTQVKIVRALNRAVYEKVVPTPSELRLIESVFGKVTTTGVVQTAGGFSEKLMKSINIPRSLQSTLDFSAVARQGLVAGWSHPVLAKRAIPEMFRAARSRDYYNKLMQEIESDPLYQLALAADISFTDISEHAAVSGHEEAFPSEYAEHIPGLGHAIKGSSRAYTAYLNKMRMDLFKERIRIAMADGKTVIHDEKFLEDVGRVVNAATGRGTVKNRFFDLSGNRTFEETFLPALNTLLFSPRLMLSRINYLNPFWYMSLHPAARREALRGLFAATGGIMSTLFLFSRIPGVDVGSFDKDHPFGDPRSADFGKLKIGNTRIDVAGGFQQYIRLASVLVTQTKVSSTTGKKTKLGRGYGAQTSLGVIADFARGKLGPVPAVLTNIIDTKNIIGEETTPENVLTNTFLPMILHDVNDVRKDGHHGIDGVVWAMGAYGLGAFGLGLQTYSGKPSTDTGFVGGSGGGDPFSGGGGGGSDPMSGGGGGGSDPFSGGGGGGGDPFSP